MATTTKPDKNSQVKEITEKLEAGIRDIFTSEKYIEYLKTLSKFHQYSLRNTLLIHQQRPGATRIAGFNTWKKEFKRNVKKGEKGIRILAPIIHKIKKETEKIDPETCAPLLDKDGNTIMVESEIVIPRFKVVSVFDVKQTEGEPLASFIENISGDVRQFEAFMETLKRISPLSIVFDKLPADTDGLCRYGEKILIREGMSQTQTVLAVIHEIAHAKLHDANALSAQDIKAKPKDAVTKEIEAESVSYTVCQYFGVETGANSFAYLANWSGNKELAELKNSLETIRNTSAEIIDGIDENFKQIVKEQDNILSAESMPQNICATDNPAPETVQETGADAEAIPDMPRTTDDVFRENTPLLISKSLYDVKYLEARKDFSDEQKAKTQCEKTVGRIINELKERNPELYYYCLFVPDFKKKITDYVFKKTYTDIVKKLEKIKNIGKNKPNNENTLENRNFNALMKLAPEVVEDKYCFIRFQAGEGFMPLTFEQLDGNRYALMHYYEQNGDIMKDPDMEIVINREKQTANALTFTQHPIIFQTVSENQIGSKEQRALDGFLSQWLRNISRQGFKRELAYMYDENYNRQNIYFNSAEKPFQIGMGHMGNGLAVWNRLEEKDGDYVTIAHIGADRNVKYYENDLPEYIKNVIENEAKTSDMTISATQNAPVFDTPPQSDVTEVVEEIEKLYPSYEGVLPDPTISIAERNEYGYTHDGLLPVSISRALELYDKDFTVYMLYDDNTESMVFERDEILADHAGIFGIEREEWELSEEYAKSNPQKAEQIPVSSHKLKPNILNENTKEDKKKPPSILARVEQNKKTIAQKKAADNTEKRKKNKEV